MDYQTDIEPVDTELKSSGKYTPIESFDDPGLKETLLRGIFSYGWEGPSHIQQHGIPAILTGKDVIMQAQSGTGKTGTFSIGTLQQIQDDVAEVQGIIILPTRELADQVYKVIQALGDKMDINFVKCVGKTRVRDNLAFADRATVLVGTPGKLNAVLSKRLIKSQPFNLRICIIDEFDKMLESDFIPTIKDIFSFFSDETQVVLSSATTNPDVMNISEQFMRYPIRITLKEAEVTLDGIMQFYVDCGKEEWKFETIMDLYNTLVVAQSIIFVNSKRKCDILEEQFRKRDFTVKSIHGGLDQEERNAIMQDYRHGTTRVLLSTDLTARGIDVQQVSLVINYELPNDKAQYIHRIGRTGRYGKKGAAINLIGSQFEHKLLEGIEDYYSTSIQELPTDFAKLIN
jgi:translation initiation factor 4A